MTDNHLSQKKISNVLQKYGFIECSKINKFLYFICDNHILDETELRYIKSNLIDCLRRHSGCTDYVRNTDNNPYFHDLIDLVYELDICINLRETPNSSER